MAEFVEMIFAQLIGNISTALIVVLFYFNFLLFENYLRLIIWAILFSQALRQAKNHVVSVLQYLSDDPDVDKYGFLTCVFSKSSEIFFHHPHDGSRRTVKDFVLNYGTFVFSLVGAVSIWMRMYSWMSFLHLCIGFWIVTLSLIKILDRRIFYYRYFVSDEVLVSALLILGFFATGIFVVLYLGTESYLEGSRAAADLSDWIQKNFINDEKTRQIWSEQVENSRAMLSTAVSGVENNYNDTMWWPPLKSLVKTYFLDSAKSGDGNVTSQASFFSKLRLPENMTIMEAVSIAYEKVDSVNVTSVQLTDWTSKGFEVSSIAFGSVAQLIFLLCTLLVAFVSLGIRAFFFLSSLFYLLCTKWDPIERFVEDLLPIQVSKRPQVVRSLRKVIEGVFFLPLKISSIHAIVTLFSFTLVNADFMYLATTFTFFISIVPIIPPYLVCVPWVISIGITSSVVKAISLFAVQYFAFTVLDDMLYEKSIVSLNSYVSALSVVFGVYVFGFEGVIFGPLSVCGVSFAYEVSNHGIQAATDEFGRNADESQGDSVEETENDGSQAESREEEVQDTEEEDGSGMNSNIFSNAMYRVISGPLADRVRRRFSIDISTEDSVCITLVVEGLKVQKKVRFVVNKEWNQRALHDSIRRMLHVHSVEGIFTPDGLEVLSPLHMLPNEVLHVKVRPKTRSHTQTDSVTSQAESQVRVTLPHRNISPSFRRSFGSTPSQSSSNDSADGKSPSSSSVQASETVGKKGFSVGIPVNCASTLRHKRGRLRRQHSVPMYEDAVTASKTRRRRSLGAEEVNILTQRAEFAKYAETSEDSSHEFDISNQKSASMYNSSTRWSLPELSIPDHNGFITAERYHSPTQDELFEDMHGGLSQDRDQNESSSNSNNTSENVKKQMPKRATSASAVKDTKVIFSPMAVDHGKLQHIKYPLDDDTKLDKLRNNESESNVPPEPKTLFTNWNGK